nr:unnamed protein product [Naegleria fowleri]
MGIQIFENVKDVVERKIFNKCVDELHETQKFYEECMEDLDKAIDMFKKLLHEYCVKNSQIFNRVNETLDDISQAVFEKLDNLSNDTRDLICDAAACVLELIEHRFKLVDVNFLILDNVLALQMTFILGKGDEEKVITLKNINLRKLKNIVVEIANAIISPFTTTPNQHHSSNTSSNHEEQMKQESKQQNTQQARRRGGFCCFRGD